MLSLKVDYIKKKLLIYFPNQCHLLFKYCKKYVDLYNGDNDDNIETNGELRLMKSALPNCKTVFDIGANIGNWATRALSINPLIDLYCFEPSKVTFDQLLKNNFPTTVKCHNFGMSSEAGEAKLWIFEDGAGINSLYRRQGLEDIGLETQQKEEIIELDTVDRYCNSHGIDHIDFCKIDVEGHELEVFKGMTTMLQNNQIKISQFEYGGCNIDSRVLLKDIFQFFDKYDYSFYKIFPQGLRRVHRYDQRLENYQYQNWAIIANDYQVS